jgi:Chaperone of endosialidase
MADYALPSVVEKRVRYFDGQFLQDQDFIDEQNYQMDREHRHNRLLHGPGIADGLTVTSTAPNQVTVAPGTAVDADGYQLVLAQATPVPLPAPDFNNRQGVELYISYLQTAVDAQTVTGSAGDTRWLERPQLTALAPGQAWSGAAPPVLLAKLALDASGRVAVDNTVRAYSGLLLPGSGADAAILHATSSGPVELAGSLTVDGSLGIGTTTAPSARLSVVGPGAIEIGGTAQSGVFRTSAGALGNASGSEVVLSSTGLTVSNNMSLGVRAIRTTAGTDWYSTAIGLGMDVDNTPRAGASLFLHANGNVGIGTPAPAVKLHVSGGVAQLDGNQRLLFTDTDTSNNLKVQLWTGYGLGINGGTLFYAANGRHSWRDDSGVNERMALTTAADGGLTVMGTGASTFAGSVGIGNSPGYPLHLAVGKALRIEGSSSSSDSAPYFSFGGNGAFSIDAPGVPGGRFVVQNSGHVGIATANPSYDLEIGNYNPQDRFIALKVAGGNAHISGIKLWTWQDNYGYSIQYDERLETGNGLHIKMHKLDPNGVPRLFLGWDGTMGIGTTTTSGQALCVNGGTWVTGTLFVSRGIVLEVGPNQWKGMYGWGIDLLHPVPLWAVGDAGGPSDVRLKTDLRPVSHALELVRQFQAVRYRWGEDGLRYLTRDIDDTVCAGPGGTESEHQQARQEQRGKALTALAGDRVGLVAQDVEAVVPELVHEDGDGYKHLRYQHLTALLTEAIKEQDAVVRALSAKVAALQAGQDRRAV